MTRINVVPVEELCNAHLFAEFRELTRIPNTIVNGKAVLDGNYPKEYTLGKGHVKFFYPRLKFLHNRYQMLYKELCNRGYRVACIWPKSVPECLYNDYIPTEYALSLNRERIKERMPENAKWGMVG